MSNLMREVPAPNPLDCQGRWLICGEALRGGWHHTNPNVTTKATLLWRNEVLLIDPDQLITFVVRKRLKNAGLSEPPTVPPSHSTGIALERGRQLHTNIKTNAGFRKIASETCRQREVNNYTCISYRPGMWRSRMFIKPCFSLQYYSRKKRFSERSAGVTSRFAPLVPLARNGVSFARSKCWSVTGQRAHVHAAVHGLSLASVHAARPQQRVRRDEALGRTRRGLRERRAHGGRAEQKGRGRTANLEERACAYAYENEGGRRWALWECVQRRLTQRMMV